MSVRYRIRGGRPLRGRVRVPGDKSIGHRSIIFASLAEGRSEIEGLSGGLDNLATAQIFREMGVAIELDGTRAVVDGVGVDGLSMPKGVLDCGNSGTTMRLIAGILADGLSPIDNSDDLNQVLDNARTELTVLRFSPDQLYTEATGVLLSPERQTTGILVLDVDTRTVPSTLSLTQSVLLAWWQVMAISAGAIAMFTIAYLIFLRQEVRA